MLNFIVMVVVGKFHFYIFLRLTWEFLTSESECESSVCWPNNKIIEDLNHFEELILVKQVTTKKVIFYTSFF